MNEFKISLFPGIAVRKGRLPGWSGIDKFGHNPSVGTSRELVTDFGGVYSYPSTAISLTISSDDAADTAAGAGARQVEVIGLGGDGLDLEETVTLNGLTPVALVNDFLRVFRMRVLDAGSFESNEGNLYVGFGTVTSGVPATILAQIASGENRSLMAMYTVPSNRRGWITYFEFDTGGSGNTETTLWIATRVPGGTFETRRLLDTKQSSGSRPIPLPIECPPLTDIECSARLSTGSGPVSMAFDVFLEHE